jgi:hypothetical protein
MSTYKSDSDEAGFHFSAGAWRFFMEDSGHHPERQSVAIVHRIHDIYFATRIQKLMGLRRDGQAAELASRGIACAMRRTLSLQMRECSMSVSCRAVSSSEMSVSARRGEASETLPS